MSEVTRILSCIEQGDPRAVKQLFPLVYEELRRLAAHKLAVEKPGQTLDATALVHEAYLRLVDSEQRGSSAQWRGRRHFFAAAAEAMRRILVENARRKHRQRHGGGLVRKSMDQLDVPDLEPADDLLALDEALEKLGKADASAAELVRLRYFAGMTIAQIAEMMNVSERTADRLWAYARAFLHSEIYGQN